MPARDKVPWSTGYWLGRVKNTGRLLGLDVREIFTVEERQWLRKWKWGQGRRILKVL